MKIVYLYALISLLYVAHTPNLIITDASTIDANSKVEKITATMYNALVSQCDDDPFITAGMYKINPEKASEHGWVALSRNLLNRWGGEFNYGDSIKISNAGHKSGIYIVVDTMNKKFHNRIDFLETLGTSHYVYQDVVIEKI